MKKGLVIAGLAIAAVIAIVEGGQQLLEPDYSIAAKSHVTRESGVDTARRKVEADPASAANWAELGEAYLGDAKATGEPKMFELAKEAADRVLQFDTPHRKNARVVLAEVALSRDDFKTALNELAAIDGEFDEALGPRARALYGAGRYREAAEAATRFAEKRPSSEAFRWRGLTREAVGNVEGAERDLIAAIGLESKTDLDEAIANRHALAEFYLHTGDHGRAHRVLATALKVSEEARLNGLLGEIELASGKARPARAAFVRAFEKGRDPRWLVRQATAERESKMTEAFRGTIDLAIELLKGEIASGRTSRRALLAEALVESAKPGEIDLAATQIAEALADRRDFETLAVAIRIALLEGDMEKAKSGAAEIEASGVQRQSLRDLVRSAGG